MGTRAYICKTIDDVNCVGIYCQLDGGLNHTGRLLVADYQKGRKVNELLAKGDLLWPLQIFFQNQAKNQKVIGFKNNSAAETFFFFFLLPETAN